ncbi:MAG: glycosyltransferase [Oligoflexia bacterium]|nr:glycosyltransferase [Oligoflexia bacterium]
MDDFGKTIWAHYKVSTGDMALAVNQNKLSKSTLHGNELRFILKTLVVIDTFWIGHIPTYHKIIVERLLYLGHRVISVSQKPEELQQWARIKGFNIENVKFRKISNESKDQQISNALKEQRFFSKILKFTHKLPMKYFKQSVSWWMICRTSIENAVLETGWVPDLVFFPGIEPNIISKILTGALVDQIFPYKWFGLYLTPKYLRKPFLKFLHKRLFRKDRFFHSKNCISIAVLDEGIVNRLESIFTSKKILVMPDVSFTEVSGQVSLLDQQLIEKARGRKIIGLVGEISKRKGIITLINVANMAIEKNKDYYFAFIGPLNALNNNKEDLLDLQKIIAKAPENCFFHLERVPDERVFNDLICRCDIIFAAYEKFYHSSNILTKAAFFQRPVVVSDGYCMSERTRKFDLGICVPEKNPSSCFQAIESLLQGKDLSGRKLNPQYKSYSSLHSLEKFDSFLEKVIGSTALRVML